MSIVAIVVAGGPGSRLGADVPKGFVRLAGEALMARSLRAMLASPVVSRAVVVVPPGHTDEAKALLESARDARPLLVIEGGVERQDSVRNGLAAAGDADVVAIHDAARPFVSRAAVDDAIATARQYGAAIVATPATDTIKLVHPDGWVETTPPRDRLWLAQTPQVFRANLLRRAHARAPHSLATDDALLVEALGERVYVVRGNPENRKITTPDDLRWAEALLARAPAPR
ncbi:MAG: 2-C-methyl-D-erythritol 4-phosphate cytidylyltransferase [Deltaproteobacteria bacterium]|nr:2-C-methyl-D-erythritol 4-phosphate cytidylyltransferase [Deltaproteobacteria bacterium]